MAEFVEVNTGLTRNYFIIILPFITGTSPEPWCLKEVNHSSGLNNFISELAPIASRLEWDIVVVYATEFGSYDLSSILSPDNYRFVDVLETADPSLSVILTSPILRGGSDSIFGVFPSATVRPNLGAICELLALFTSVSADIVAHETMPDGVAPCLFSRRALQYLANIGMTADLLCAGKTFIYDLIEMTNGEISSVLKAVLTTISIPESERGFPPVTVTDSTSTLRAQPLECKTSQVVCLGERSWTTRSTDSQLCLPPPSIEASMQNSGGRPAVCFCSAATYFSGAEISLQQLILSLCSSIFPVVFLSRDCVLYERLRAAGIFCVQCGRDLLEPSAEAVNELARCLDRLGVQLVHADSFSCLGPLLAARKLGIPVVQHVRTIPRRIPTDWHLVDNIIGVSDTVIARLVSLGCRARRLTRIYPGVELPISPEHTIQSSNEVTYCNGSPPDSGPLILHVGRVCGQKGHHVAVQIMSQIVKFHPDAKLLFVGEVFPQQWPYYQHLKQQVSAVNLDGNVTFVDFRRDIAELYLRASVFIHTGFNEAFGRSIVESMTQRVPVVSFAGDGPSEIISDGISGFLIERGDIAGFGERVCNVLSGGPAIERVIDEAARAVRHYSLSRQRDEVCEVYHSLL